jgi:hypothetical protein
MFLMTITAYPDTPADFALYGALTWLDTGEVIPRVSDGWGLLVVEQACRLAAVDVAGLLGMVRRGFISFDWNTHPEPVDN